MTDTGGLPRRKALDGVRALAIVGVLLYHSGASWSAGGFLGVDLFFVVSGFLITSLLLDRHDRTGSLGLQGFWGARARRLLPALALLVVAVLWVFPALGVRWPARTPSDALSAVLFVSNWRFIASGESYVDQAAGPSPLLHTWSLGIEEQWYLVLPIVLLVVLRLRRPAVLPTLLVVGAVASAITCAVLYQPGSVDRAYLGTDARVQALLVGALTATLLRRRAWGERPSPRLALLAWPGLVGTLVLMAVADPTSSWIFRGGFLLVAVVACMLVVGVVASADQGPLAVVLGSAPLRGIGVISYGLYLWHWPIFLALDSGRVGFGGVGLFAVRVGTSLAVATASYWLLERPVRRRRKTWDAWGPIGAITAAVAVVVTALVLPAAAVPNQGNPLVALQKAAKEAARTPAPTASTPTSGASGARTVVLVGDSQALALWEAIHAHPGDGLTVRIATRFGCGVVPYVASVQDQALSQEQPLCGDWATARESEIAAQQADVGVLFAGSWEQYDREVDGHDVSYTSAQWRRLTVAAYTEVLREMTRHVKHVTVALDHCHLAPKLDLPVSVQFQAGRYPPVVNDVARVAAVNDAMREAAKAVGDVPVLDVDARLCAHGPTAKVDGVTMRTDGLHWTTAGAKLVWHWMRPQLLAAAQG